MLTLRTKLLLISFFLGTYFVVNAQENKKPAFQLVPLGVKGGLDESNLSAYLLAPAGSGHYICLDAGTLQSGIRKWIDKQQLPQNETQFLREQIKCYLLSHAHLDHVSGLIINSPADTSKPIYAMPAVLDIIRDKYFSWKSWANFGSEGEAPVLNKYRYVPLAELQETRVEGTEMTLKPFLLSHLEPYLSTAFLLNYQGDQVLYFGDTGADKIEKTDRLERIWKAIAPAIRSGKLRAILIEVSFPDEQPLGQLFGHLSPRLLMEEMQKLAHFAGADKLKDFPLVITHQKPDAQFEGRIKQQLEQQNKLGLKLIFPEQGTQLEF